MNKYFDYGLGLSALVSLTLVTAGSKLMMGINKVHRAFGIFTFILGALLLGNTISGNVITEWNYMNNRYIIAIVSVLLIVVGTMVMYFHFEKRSKISTPSQLEEQESLNNIINTIPQYSYWLLYIGYVGIVTAIALNNDMTINWTKGVLAVIALIVIWWTKNRYMKAVLEGKNSDKQVIAHMFSLLLLVIVISGIV